MEHRRSGYEIRQEFRDLGSQGGQPITTVQLETALKRRHWEITQTEMKAMVRFADQNGDSTVTLFEFARLRHMLDALDHSKTRRLNASDLRIELDSLGLEATDEKIKQMLEVAGVAESRYHEDGKVNVLEFWRLLTALPRRQDFDPHGASSP